MIKVLHITAHMGGGVGNALSSITAYSKKMDNKYVHRILMLEPPQKTQFVEICKQKGIDVIYATDIDVLRNELLEADIVQMSWWHHPIMAKVLSDFPKIPIRLIVWVHISGCTYPIVPFDFAKMPHKMFFTTNYSFENPYWDELQKNYMRINAELIYGAGDFSDIENTQISPHLGFNIGYIGTLNYSKINPEFIKFCKSVKIPSAKFIIAGDIDNKELVEDVKRYELDNMIEFKGYVKNVASVLSNIDVFGYPLNPFHFGTTENAILEAMAASLPVVALNQGAEKYIIKHMETGLLANNIGHYGELMRYLYENPNERKRIGKNARSYVMSTFSLEKTVGKMNAVYDEIMHNSKKEFQFNNVFGNEPYEWFLSCLGDERKIFEESIDEKIKNNQKRCEQIEEQIRNSSHILREKSKSSICQFYSYFPDDQNLSYWNSIINSIRLG